MAESLVVNDMSLAVYDMCNLPQKNHLIIPLTRVSTCVALPMTKLILNIVIIVS